MSTVMDLPIKISTVSKQKLAFTASRGSRPLSRRKVLLMVFLLAHLHTTNKVSGKKTTKKSMLYKLEILWAMLTKWYPPLPMFCIACPCFALGNPKIMRRKILNRRCSMASCSEQFLNVSWNSGKPQNHADKNLK